jgi:hypothetical protein
MRMGSAAAQDSSGRSTRSSLRRVTRPVSLSMFGIRHSAFCIRRPAFGIRRSAFGIRHSAFGVRRSAESGAWWTVIPTMLDSDSGDGGQ